jgi:hypothetical protein
VQCSPSIHLQMVDFIISHGTVATIVLNNTYPL